MQSLLNVQLNTGLSNTGMRQLASTLNKATETRLVEPFFQQKFAAVGKSLNDFFQLSVVNISAEKGKAEEKRTIIHCKNLEDLTNKVLLSREYGSNHFVKLGIDGGGSFLKMSLAVIKVTDEDDETRSPQQKSLRLLTSSSARDTGVKRQLIVAIAENVSETYENVKLMMNIIQLNDVSFCISCDLKMANIICGIQSHSSKHPCCWCNIDSDNLSECGTSRSFGSIKERFEAYVAAGSDTKSAKDFDNVIHPPLIKMDDSTLILDVIPPMELHLLLGIVNHLFKNLSELWPGAKEWPTLLHIQLQPYHGGHFAGNECHKLLQNLDILQRMAEKACAYQAFGFIETLRHFKEVVTSCFGTTLQENYKETIQKFKTSFLFLPISVTPKVHAVFYHVSEFVEKHQTSLGIFSEQATEAMHSRFKVHWERYKRIPTHPEYGKQLFNCVVDYNSKHL